MTTIGLLLQHDLNIIRALSILTSILDSKILTLQLAFLKNYYCLICSVQIYTALLNKYFWITICDNYHSVLEKVALQ